MRVTVPQELLERLDKPGPRYTSYPTVPAWTGDFGPEQWDEALDEFAAQPERDASLYVHLPYCIKRCHYCGCNAAVPDNRADVDRYLDHLEQRTRSAGREGRPTPGDPDALGRRHAQLPDRGADPPYMVAAGGPLRAGR